MEGAKIIITKNILFAYIVLGARPKKLIGSWRQKDRVNV